MKLPHEGRKGIGAVFEEKSAHPDRALSHIVYSTYFLSFLGFEDPT